MRPAAPIEAAADIPDTGPTPLRAAEEADLAARVQAAAAKLGYVPDPAARALASQRSTHVAVLIPMLSNELFVSLLEAVQASMRRAGYQTLIGVTWVSSRKARLSWYRPVSSTPTVWPHP